MILKGKLKTNDVAREQYEDVVQRDSEIPPPPRDPVLLEWIRDDNYDISIFPVSFGGTRKVRIRYLIPAFMRGGANKIGYPHAFSANATVSIKAGPGVKGYVIEAGSHRKQFENTAFSPLSAGDYSFRPYRTAGTTISYIIPILSNAAGGSNLYVGRFSTPSFSGEMLHVSTMSAEEALTKTSVAEDFVILWRWNHPEILARYGRQIVEQSKLLTAFLESLNESNKRAALVISKQGGEQIVFKLSKKGGHEYKRMLAYLEQLAAQQVIDPPLKQSPVSYDIPFDFDKALAEFEEALATAQKLFEQHRSALKHLLVLTAGPVLVKKYVSQQAYNWDSAIAVGLLVDYMRNKNICKEIDLERHPVYWPAVDITGFANRYHGDLKVFATVRNSIDSSTIAVKTLPQENCTYCTYSVTTEMHLYSATTLQKQIDWTVYSGAKLVGQYTESPNVTAIDDGMQYARCIGASKYLTPLAATMPSSMASTLGFIDEKYSLVALEEDALPPYIASRYEQSGVPLLESHDIFPAGDETAAMPVTEWLALNPPQSLTRRISYRTAYPQTDTAMALEFWASPIHVTMADMAGAPEARNADAEAGRIATPAAPVVYADDPSLYVDYSDALALSPAEKALQPRSGPNVFIRNNVLTVSLGSLSTVAHGQITLVLCDCSGRKVLEQCFSPQAKIHIPLDRDIAKGAYVLRLLGAELSIRTRIVVR
jgi:hypothetical protein